MAACICVLGARPLPVSTFLIWVAEYEIDGDPGLGRGQTDDAAGVAHQNRGAGLLVMRIELLERHHVRLERLDHVGHAVVDFDQPGGERLARSAAHDAGLAQHQPARLNFHHAVAGGVQVPGRYQECGP